MMADWFATVTSSNSTGFALSYDDMVRSFNRSFNERKKGNNMSTPVTTPEQLRALKPGDRIVVRQEGGGTKTWTVNDDHGYARDGAVITESAFSGAINNGNVFLPGDYHVGQALVSGTQYMKIVGREGDDWVVVACDSRGSARSIEVTVGEPVGARVDGGMVGNAILEPAWTIGAKLRDAEINVARIQAMLDTGRVPDEVGYSVSVKVKGNVGIQPSNAQARRLVGDNKIAVLAVNSADVSFTKDVTITKPSRWGCACEQVTAEDLEGAVPGDITYWSVTRCTPAARGGVSEVHTADVA